MDGCRLDVCYNWGMNILRKTTALAQQLWLPYLTETATAIDATCGGGNDTLFLCQNCGMVYGFDIQPEAIETTEKLLKEHHCTNYQLINDSHTNMDRYVACDVDVIVFNLGYLPNGNKEITTVKENTLAALEKALKMIRVDGLVSLTMYWGHEAGKQEREAVLAYCRQLDSSQYHCVYLSSLNQPNCPPEIVLITRKK